MQIPRISRLEESIFFIICGYLFNSLTWRLLHASSSLFSPRSILGTTNPGYEGSGKDQAYTRNVPRCSQAVGNQFLPSYPAEDRCNCADFVPVREFPSSTKEPLVLDFEAVTRLLENILKIVLKYIQKLLLSILIIIYRNLQKYCDVSAQADSVERIRNSLIKPSNCKIEMDRSKSTVVDEETTDKQSSITGKRSSTNRISFQEYLTKFLLDDADRSQEKFHNDGAGAGNRLDVARSQREEYAANVYDRKNGDITWNDNDPSSHKFGSRSEIARYDADDNSASLDTEIKENAESILVRSLAGMFLASILEDSDVFGTENKEMEEKYSTKAEGKENANVFFVDDEIRSEVLADRSVKCLTLAAESDKICSRMEDDYPGEQSGMLPEKRLNLVKEESVMHSDKNAVQCEVEETETGEELGSAPGAGSLKNCRKSESTGFSDPPPITDHGKEEEDLKTIVRRMIVVELKKHRKKEKIVLKRAHSDSETLIPRKRHSVTNRSDFQLRDALEMVKIMRLTIKRVNLFVKFVFSRHNCFRIGLCNLKGRTLFRDLLELEESLRKNSEDKSNESVKVEVDEGTTKREESTNEDENQSRNDAELSEIADRANAAENVAKTTCQINSNIMVKRKINLPCLTSTELEEEQSTELKKTSEIRKHEQENKTTQTERVYVIRAVRSCPLRKRRVSLQLQLHRLTDREPYYSRIVYASRDFSRFMHRKASDDLIYEKGKGSRSPSYIPAPERFRWKYLMPNKVK